MTQKPTSEARYLQYQAHSSDDNAWASIRDKTKKIVISKGITSIPESAFAHFNEVKEVAIASGLKSIGKEAFYNCDVLSKITIPASVTKIGEDILWTGSYWTFDNSHVTYATIYTTYGSYAAKYAKKNEISCHINTTKISKAKISGLKNSYVYNGKAQKPKVTVKLDNKQLKQDSDYKISYSNNKNTGNAAVKITGIHSYSGTITKTFKILPKKMSAPKLTSSKTKTIRLTWKKDAQATGYQIQYAKNSKFTSGSKTITTKNNTTVTKTISSLNKKQKYYARIRAYKKINGTNCYGAWSSTVSIKCK